MLTDSTEACLFTLLKFKLFNINQSVQSAPCFNFSEEFPSESAHGYHGAHWLNCQELTDTFPKIQQESLYTVFTSN